ncbi:hypothetical protein NUU61_009707 [Penicillium alfredii]|uniref:Uncharacterized protein n=1 Tax=Penicillium alfredii TaxID=1506179 RepID=A0A9W9EGL3_9EURO|nr:uncharacterized protein NUU61_009707 [Penicillium alfredii]KAJ5081443.1 hypothetical protein NUU61_009707 [Penicillium alfredii]
MRSSSDALRHLLLKISRERANRNAPPPYSSVPPPAAMSEMSMATEYRDIRRSDEDGEPAPITITLDTAIIINGNRNTVVLPSGAGSPTMPTSSHADDTTTPTTTASSASSSSSSSSSPRPAQSLRQAKLTHMAILIIAALNQAGGLSADGGRGRPISIVVNAGVRVSGNDNVITMGSSTPRRQAFKAPEQPPVPKEARKRRASSTPAIQLKGDGN